MNVSITEIFFKKKTDIKDILKIVQEFTALSIILTLKVWQVLKIFSTQKAIYRSFYILILKQQLQQIIVLIPNKERRFVVSYVIIVTFHPALNLDRIMIQRSYAHSIDQLTSLNYFSDDQMKFNNLEIIRQLKDIDWC